MTLEIVLATPEDAAEIAALQSRVAEALTLAHGRGHWSHLQSEQGTRRGMEHARTLVARIDGAIVGTLRLTRRKPWAIDRRAFTPCGRPIYLMDMAVDPARQRRGIGRRLMMEAERVAAEWDGGTINLEAYDHAAGGTKRLERMRRTRHGGDA